MTPQFWNERYSAAAYAYGTEPNQIFKTLLDKLPSGKLLLPAEGEGRNAVYAAAIGWQVDAFDTSVAGQQKALQLAASQQVKINYSIDAFETFKGSASYYDAIALIFTHLPPSLRREAYRNLLPYLKTGGKLIVIGFAEAQLGKASGGPKSLDMLYSEQQLREDFESLQQVQVEAIETTLDEGPFHSGVASILVLTAVK